MSSVISCLGAEAKVSLMRDISRQDAGLAELLSDLPTCKGRTPIGFSQTGKRAKRPPTAYQQFVGECLKAKSIKSFNEAPKAMRGCAQEWKAKQGKR